LTIYRSINAICARTTEVASPTTTGKIERFQQSAQIELLNEEAPFADLPSAQRAVDRWRHEYNYERPHQALDMATPASRFFPIPKAERELLALRLPPELSCLEAPAEATGPETPVPDPADQPFASPDAVEIDRVVPPSGNLGVAGQQFWLGRHLAGEVVCLWIDTKLVHLSVGGRRLKTVPSRIAASQLAKLRSDGGRGLLRPLPRRLGKEEPSRSTEASMQLGWCRSAGSRSASASFSQDAG
jgi:hypothetical protein